MDEDKRFAHVKSDPKFRRIPKGERKVKIDKRFKSMFKDKKFKVKYTIDKRGRPVNKTSSEDLRRYYELSSGDESSSDEKDEESSSDKNEEEPVKSEEENELEAKHKSVKTLSGDIKKKLSNLNFDYARGECTLSGESSSDDEESEDDEDEDDIEHKWGELDNDAEQTEEATYRLAACNMDWDRIRDIDLLVLFSSFLPPGGLIKSVIIYPSEFGKQRMKDEEVKGPIELVEQNVEEEETEEGSKYHMEKLRQYQLNRLKYYYAVIEFDSASSANKIYTECDGMEYESSAIKIDLRFIPDDMVFTDEPKEACSTLPELCKYMPRFFTTTALQQVKVDLTWDETDPNRIEVTQKLNEGKIDDISEADLQNYLAVSSEGEESDNESIVKLEEAEENDDPIGKYRALLQDIEEKEKEKSNRDIEMEVSWGVELKEKSEQLVKKKLSEYEEKTPFQQYLDKRKQKRKQKRLEHKKEETNDDSDIPSDIDLNDKYFAEEFNNDEFKKKTSKRKSTKMNESSPEINGELELLLMNEDDSKKHFSLKIIQEQEKQTMKKKKRKHKRKEKIDADDDFQINVHDDRFSALFTSHLYNIDPTDPHFKKTKSMDILVNEKMKRRNDDDDDNCAMTTKKMKPDKTKDAKLSALVKSVKRKSEPLHKSKINK